MNRQQKDTSPILARGIAILVLGLLALEVAALILWVPGTWHERTRLVLQVIGLYGIAVGFMSRSDVPRDFRGTLQDMTSPNLYKFMLGNFSFAIFPTLLMATALSKRKLAGAPVALTALGNFSCLFLTPLVFVYVFFHLLVIMPLTYLPYLLASSLVSNIVYSGEDYMIRAERRQLGNAAQQREVSMKAIIEANPAAAKSFVVGVPAVLLSLLSHVSAWFPAG
jgi:hypothetical protein